MHSHNACRSCCRTALAPPTRPECTCSHVITLPVTLPQAATRFRRGGHEGACGGVGRRRWWKRRRR
eukprot:2961311-Rhodomonas_salina.1